MGMLDKKLLDHHIAATLEIEEATKKWKKHDEKNAHRPTNGTGW